MFPNYPFKFIPVPKYRIWGGNKLKEYLNKPFPEKHIGESWEISSVPGDISVVSNGTLHGKNLNELIENYPNEVLGKKVIERFGVNFPLLIKFIDAHSDLSIQLHPNDELAMQRHHSLGKEEMWYIMEAEQDSRLLFGFNTLLDKDTYSKHLQEHTLEKVMHNEKVQKGDVFHIPAGRVHAIGSGIVLAEIQQSSDITYRLFDWNRLDDEGNSRELHTDLALDAIDFTIPKSFKSTYQKIENTENKLIEGNYFTTHFLNLNQSMHFDHQFTDTFVIYIGVEGSGRIVANNHDVSIQMGETILIPAYLQQFSIIPDKGGMKLIQVIP